MKIFKTILLWIIVIIAFFVITSYNIHIFIMIFGILAFYRGLKSILELKDLKTNGVVTWGKIIDYRWVERSNVPLIEYLDFEGNLQQNTLTHYATTDIERITGNKEYKNQYVEILVHSIKPNIIAIEKDIKFTYFAYGLFVLMGILFFTMGLYNL